MSKVGGDAYAADAIVEDIDMMGSKKIVLKTDQEPAILDLAKEVRNKRDLETVPENSPVGDSQANGLAEKGVQEIAGQIRVLKLGLEANYQCTIPVRHPIMPWLIE